MLCQDCSKRDKCTKPCQRLEKHLKRYTKSQRESTKSEFELDLLSTHVYPLSYKELASYWSGGTPHFNFLTPLQNKILYLFYFEGLRHKQIARMLNGGRNPLTSVKLSVNAVTCQIYKAKQKIRHHYSSGKRDKK